LTARYEVSKVSLLYLSRWQVDAATIFFALYEVDRTMSLKADRSWRARDVVFKTGYSEGLVAQLARAHA
jgi:hypothetical protein